MPPVVESSQVLPFLSQVRNEGGVVFAGLAEKAWRGADEKAAEAAYELAWEELHAGPWQSVPLVWRDAFAFSCLSLASCHHRANRSVEALKVLDLGVIMGGSKFRTELDFSINSISSSTGTEIAVSAASVEDFLCDYFLFEVPIVHLRSINSWPAMRKWPICEGVAGRRNVPCGSLK